jgi:hypothetical protein
MGRRIGGAGGGSDPGPSKGDRFVAVAALTLAVAAAGAGVGGSSSLSASSTGQAADTAARQSINAKKVEGKRAARKGNAEEAWRRMGCAPSRRP